MYIATVRNSNKLKIKMKTLLPTNITETFNFNKTIAEVNGNTVLAGQIDTFARNFTNLTTNNYDDTEIVTIKCLESIAGGAN